MKNTPKGLTIFTSKTIIGLKIKLFLHKYRGVFSFPSISIFKTLKKEYRTDLKVWEEEISFLGTITYYKYLIWREGKTITNISFYKKNKYEALYFKMRSQI